MAQIWDPNEEIGEDDELVVTDHRDADAPAVTPEEEPVVETARDTPQEALDELGEDVGSSPASRAREGLDPERDGER